MSFSVVIVALDAAKDLALTLESVLQQTFRDFEIIVVDGYSIDGTADVISRYVDGITSIVQEEDSGIFDAMNRAVKLCTKEYVVFMNAKDRFYCEETLTRVWMRRQGDPDVMYGEHIYVDSGMEKYVRAQRFDFIWQSLLSGDISARWHESIPCHQATFTRRKLLELQPYDTRLELCADHDFLFKAFTRGFRYQYIDEIVCHYFGGGLSAQRSKRLKFELVHTYRKYSKRPKNVDAYFLGKSSTVFANETATTGLRLTGFDLDASLTDFEQRHGLRWCFDSCFTFKVPNDQIVKSCTFTGFNPFGSQQVELRDSDQLIASARLPHGQFDSEIVFTRPLIPESEIQFILQHSAPRAEANGRTVSVACAEIVCAGPLFLELPVFDANDSLDFGVGKFHGEGRILSHGWSVLEDDHIWSITKDASLSIRISSNVTRLVLEISGNPFVPENERKLEIELNGRSLMTAELATARKSYVIEREVGRWEVERPNLLTLRVAALAKPPLDERYLGACLYKINFD